MPEAVFTAEAEPESLLDVEEGATCWMTTLPPVLPTWAPTKPPTKPMAAASTSATALRAILLFSGGASWGLLGASLCGLIPEAFRRRHRAAIAAAVRLGLGAACAASP